MCILPIALKFIVHDICSLTLWATKFHKIWSSFIALFDYYICNLISIYFLFYCYKIMHTFTTLLIIALKYFIQYV